MILIQDRGAAPGDGFLAGRMLRQQRASCGECAPLVSLLIKLLGFKHGNLILVPCLICHQPWDPHFQTAQSECPALASPPEMGPAWVSEENTGHFPLENWGGGPPKKDRTTQEKTWEVGNEGSHPGEKSEKPQMTLKGNSHGTWECNPKTNPGRNTSVQQGLHAGEWASSILTVCDCMEIYTNEGYWRGVRVEHKTEQEIRY